MVHEVVEKSCAESGGCLVCPHLIFGAGAKFQTTGGATRKISNGWWARSVVATLAFWLDAYDEEPDGDAIRVVSHIHRDLAPVTVAILPLSRNEKLTPTARRIYGTLRKHFNTQYDDAQGIGRRYRRQDEIGTPFCVTIDFDTIDDDQGTIRDRDSMHHLSQARKDA